MVPKWNLKSKREKKRKQSAVRKDSGLPASCTEALFRGTERPGFAAEDLLPRKSCCQNDADKYPEPSDLPPV